MLIVLAKIGTVGDVGQFSLGLAITAPVFAFSNLQLRAISATDAAHRYSPGNYLAFRMIATTAAMGGVVGLAMLGHAQGAGRVIIIAIGLAKAFEAMSDILYGLMQRYEAMKPIALSLLLKGPFSLLCLAIAMVATHSLVLSTLALAGSWGLLLLLFDNRNAQRLYRAKTQKSLQPDFSTTSLARLALFAFPMGIVILLNSLGTNIPRYVIARHLGDVALGYYSAIAYLFVAGGVVISAVGESASPRLAVYYLTDHKAFKSLLIKLLAIAVCIGVLGVCVALLFGKELLTIVYTRDYADYTRLLIWTMIAAGVTYCTSILGYAVTATHSFLSQSILTVAVVCTISVSSYFFIPKFGLNGGAMAIAVGYLLQAAGLIVELTRLLRQNAAGSETLETPRLLGEAKDSSQSHE
jgi:O-antigen/teichoic acid export membrane protein